MKIHGNTGASSAWSVIAVIVLSSLLSTTAASAQSSGNPPTITDDTGQVLGRGLSVEENTVGVQALRAVDREGDSFSWALSGADGALFELFSATSSSPLITLASATSSLASATSSLASATSSLASATSSSPAVGDRTLRFKAAPDFENPADTDTNNVYEVTVTVSDGTNSTSHDFEVTVTDVDEAPASLPALSTPTEPKPEPEPKPKPETVDRFVDVAKDSPHRGNIGVLVDLEVIKGKTATSFEPKVPSTRAHVASFLARLWVKSGRACPEGASDGVWADAAASAAHGSNIACLADLGIVTGVTDTTFEPDQPASRSVVASFLANAWRQAGKKCQVVESLAFTDVAADADYADDVKCIYGLGITAGKTATTYDPDGIVTREQMASFLARLWQKLQ